jgi:TM2 domain-containing membrane protein YozV
MTCRINPPVSLESKNPGFSVLLSLIFAGLGQAYNGQFARGSLILAGTLVGGFGFAPAGVAVWLYGAYDAYITARRMNEGTIPYRESSVAAVILFAAVWIVGLLFLPAAPATVSTAAAGSPCGDCLHRCAAALSSQ